jgi:hypothetical protein
MKAYRNGLIANTSMDTSIYPARLNEAFEEFLTPSFEDHVLDKIDREKKKVKEKTKLKIS